MRFFYTTLLILCSLFHALAQQNKIVCGTSDGILANSIIERMARLPVIIEQQRARAAAGEMNICRIGVEIDYQTYLKFEQDTNLIFRQVHEDIHEVSEVYEREINTRVVVTSIRIFKSPASDPFNNASDIYQLLGILTNTAPANQDFDKRMYLFSKNVMGAGGVGNMDGKHSVSPLGNPLVIMHELGHNFGSPHTQNCSWPGGPIDFCVNPEGGCYDKALEALYDNSGTVMSYCEREPTFHPLCQALMQEHADRLFSKIISIPATPAIPLNALVSPGDFLYWQPSPAALSYEVTYATKTDFSDAKTISMPFNGFQIRGIAAGSALFVKIRAVNSFGASSWSQPVSIKTSSDRLAPPELNMNGSPQIVPYGSAITLSYSAVPGAAKYEIQIANPVDASFQNPYVQNFSNTSEFRYTALLPAMLKWRVRAVNGNGQSKWSEPGFFSVNPSRDFPLLIPFDQNAPKSFPFSYSPSSTHVKIRVSVANNRDFNNAFFVKDYNHVGPVADVVANLPPNSNLFFRLEEWNEDDTYYPKAKTIDYILPFSTLDSSLPAELTFLSASRPDLFNYGYPRISLTSKYVWLASRSKGFVRIDQQDLSYQVFNRNNTDGLLGYLDLPAPFPVNDSLKMQVMSFQANGRFLRAEFRDDNPSKPLPLGQLQFAGLLTGYDPSHRLYWSGPVIYTEIDNTLAPLKTYDGNWYIRKVIVQSGKAHILSNHYNGQAEITVMDPVSGKELERINSATHPGLLPGIEQFSVARDGKIMILQYDPATKGNRILLWDKQTWTTLSQSDALVSGGKIESIAGSPTGSFYALVSGQQTRILKYSGSKWEQLGADIPLLNFAANIEIDASDNIWFAGAYGLARLSQNTFNPVTGIAEKNWPKVTMYPNPVSDQVVIQYAEQNNKPARYHISNIRGNVVATREVREKLTYWDIRHLPSGIYVLWTVQNGSKRSWKIVKN